MESHIGADLLHELMPSKFEDLNMTDMTPPCLLTAIGTPAEYCTDHGMSLTTSMDQGKTVPYSSKIKMEETGQLGPQILDILAKPSQNTIPKKTIKKQRALAVSLKPRITSCCLERFSFILFHVF